MNCGIKVVLIVLLFVREQRKKLSALETQLAEARKEGFVSNQLLKKKDTDPKKGLLAVLGIITTFGRKKNRDAIRKAWMPTGNFPFSFIVSLLEYFCKQLSLFMDLNFLFVLTFGFVF